MRIRSKIWDNCERSKLERYERMIQHTDMMQEWIESHFDLGIEKK